MKVAAMHESVVDPFRTCVPSPNRLSELLSRAAQDVTQVSEWAPGSFTTIPLKRGKRQDRGTSRRLVAAHGLAAELKDLSSASDQ
jgi:hypothetical protein